MAVGLSHCSHLELFTRLFPGTLTKGSGYFQTQVNSKVHTTEVINSFTKLTLNSRLCVLCLKGLDVALCTNTSGDDYQSWRTVTQEEFKTRSVFVTPEKAHAVRKIPFAHTAHVSWYVAHPSEFAVGIHFMVGMFTWGWGDGSVSNVLGKHKEPVFRSQHPLKKPGNGDRRISGA